MQYEYYFLINHEICIFFCKKWFNILLYSRIRKLKYLTKDITNCNISHVQPFIYSTRLYIYLFISECVLAPFVGGTTSQQIPFVFLPLKGQIIHPSKEISFTGMQMILLLVLLVHSIRINIVCQNYRQKYKMKLLKWNTETLKQRTKHYIKLCKKI